MSIKAWARQHPRLAMWAVLAVGMVVILIWSARSVGLLPGQWTALIVATVLLAGLCVWIISWEFGEEEEAGESTAEPAGESPGETTGPQSPGA